MAQLLQNLARALSEYTPCDISDALVKFGHKDGGFFPNLTRYSESLPVQTTAGPAYTVLYAPIDDPRPSIQGNYIDSVPNGSIVVIGLTKNLQRDGAPYVKVNNALYGGLMSTRAQFLGARGSVIFGRIRDLDEHRGLKYPVFAYGTGTAAPGPVVKVIAVDVPLDINVGNDVYQTISPNDLIVGDENGVVRISKDIDLEALLEYIPKRVAADELVAKDISEGKPAGLAQKERRAGL